MSSHPPSHPKPEQVSLIKFLTGPAGSGKTTYVRERIKRDPKWATLTATTGIAAVNLADSTGETVRTINSLLGYFNQEDLEEKYVNGELRQALKVAAKKSRRIAVDEASMLSAEVFEFIFRALLSVNDDIEVQTRGGLGLVLVGDFCQLPPVKGSYLFRSHFWQEYMENGNGASNSNVIKLEKIYRQSDPRFLDSLNAARRGDGETAARLLRDLPGVQWRNRVNAHFEGTTIFPTNKQVDRENTVRLAELIEGGAKLEKIPSYRWGPKDTEGYNIPEYLELCKGAYVMNYVNVNTEVGLVCANGDCGYVLEVEHTQPEKTGPDESNRASVWQYRVRIELVRNGREVWITPHIRQNTQKKPPRGVTFDPPPPMATKDFYIFVRGAHKDIEGNGLKVEDLEKGWDFDQKDAWAAVGGLVGLPGEDSKGLYKVYLGYLTNKYRPKEGGAYYDFQIRAWVVGECTYMPLRLAYATSVHKCVHPTSYVVTPDRGLIQIRNITKGGRVWNGRDYVKVVDIVTTPKRAFVVETYYGYRLVCSADHRIQTRDGLLRAEQLSPSDLVSISTSL